MSHRMIKAIIIVIVVIVAAFISLIMISSNNQNSQQSALDEIAQANPSPTQPEALPTSTDSGELVTITTAVINTSKGPITLQLYPQDAPKTVSNFVQKAKSGYYNNLTFHRVEDWVVQGGDPVGNGTGGGDMTTELNNRPFVVGSLGVARGPDIRISNDSQFFITKTEADWLDGQYTNFGIVTDGMDVVKQLKIGDKITSITTQ